MRTLSGLACTLLAGCLQAVPHATVQVTPGSGAGGPVLIMPTTCVPDGVMVELCEPATLNSSQTPPLIPIAASYGAYIDPTLRLKLEFAGYTLAEGAAMRLDTGERTDQQSAADFYSASQTTVTPTATVADLQPGDVRAVARSLGLGGIVTSTFTISPSGFGEIRGDLVVTLWDTETSVPRWVVRCGEKMFGYEETPLRLANCVGNGVLAALAPDNLIGSVL